MLIGTDPIVEARLEEAKEFCWETQRLMHKWRFEGWHPLRIKPHMKARAQLWRTFPRGIRISAQQRFMEELNEQLRLPAGQRNPHKPVWLNEQFDLVPVREDGSGAGDAAEVGGIITAP